MNNQSPLVPQGSLEQKNQGRARVKIAVFFVLAVHGIGLMALLLQAGCRQQAAAPPDNESIGTSTPGPADPTTQTNIEAITPPPVATTNPLVSIPPTPVPPVVTPAPATEYTVVANDTPAGIAKKFKVKLQALLDANPGLKPTAMHPGDKLHIPAPTPTTAVPSIGPAPTATETANGDYKVKSGDNLTTIATAHGTTVKALRSLNNLKSDRITVGQTLKIPAKAAAPAAPLTTAATTPPFDATTSAPPAGSIGR
jgi:LysM repeat protein